MLDVIISVGYKTSGALPTRGSKYTQSGGHFNLERPSSFNPLYSPGF